MSREYFAFISYASQRREWVARLQRNLERCLEHYARASGEHIAQRIFLDQSDLPSGKSWVDQIQNSLEGSARLILVMSPEALQSTWVQREWQAFFTSEYPKPLFPVVIEGAELPGFLRSYQHVDFSGLEGNVYLERLTQLFGDLLGRSRRDPPPMPTHLELFPKPKPSYPDSDSKLISQALDQAYQRRAQFQAEGADVSDLNTTIVDLKRRLRSGPQLQPGDFLLDGRIELLEIIGQGGFATVWKAYDRKGQTVVAVKVLHSQYTEDFGRRTRFFRGARQMASLRHPGIVRVIETECEDDGYFFFVMEYVGGGDFRQMVLAGRLTMEERLRVILEVGKALMHAHKLGIVHRDVKPANILLDHNGSPKLTDFDLVRAADTTGGTRTAMMGTFLYAAPEAMADGKQAAEPADIYSLGMTAVFAVYGQELPSDVLWDLPQMIQVLEMPSAYRPLLLRATQRQVKERWNSVEVFCEVLSKVIEDKEVPPSAQTEMSRAGAFQAFQASERIRQPRHSSRRTFEITVLAIACIVFLVAGFGLGDKWSGRIPWHFSSTEQSLGEQKLDVLMVPEFSPFGEELPVWEQPIQVSTKELQVGEAGINGETNSSKEIDPSSDGELMMRDPLPEEELIEKGLPEACSVAVRKTGVELIAVPGGLYRLGADDVDEDSEPIHTVTLSPFWISKHPVTNRQYRRFFEETDHRKPRYWDQELFKESSLPVVGVDWEDAQAFAQWGGFLLPSEAQWEAAARGTDQRRYPWGNARPTKSLADIGDGKLEEVGKHPQGEGPFGTQDQAGGVWEWCRDTWSRNAFAGRDGQEDPVLLDPTSDVRTVRGGSTASGYRSLPSAFRFGYKLNSRFQYLGFRVVCGSASE